VVPGISASSHEGDDLEAIARGEHGGSVEGARDDLAVALDGDGLSGEAELADEGGDGGPRVHQPLLAVDDYIDIGGHVAKLPPGPRGRSPQGSVPLET